MYDRAIENMGWISLKGELIKEEHLLELYTQIKEERRYWFDKCLSYMNFYYTINVTLFTGFFLVNNFEHVHKMMIIMPTLALLICIYAKKINKICHKQFIENTVIMIKLEYLLGMYGQINVISKNQIPFEDDPYIGMERHFNNMIKYKTSDKYVDIELKEKNRSYSYNTKVLNYMIIMSIVLILYGAITCEVFSDILDVIKSFIEWSSSNELVWYL